MDEIFRGILKKTPSLGRRWKLLEVYLVEAAGVEPASANLLPSVLHA